MGGANIQHSSLLNSVLEKDEHSVTLRPQPFYPPRTFHCTHYIGVWVFFRSTVKNSEVGEGCSLGLADPPPSSP